MAREEREEMNRRWYRPRNRKVCLWGLSFTLGFCVLYSLLGAINNIYYDYSLLNYTWYSITRTSLVVLSGGSVAFSLGILNADSYESKLNKWRGW